MTVQRRRQINFRRWIDDDPHAQGDVAKWCDHYSQFVRDNERPFNPNHIRQMVPKRGPSLGAFGESVARKIERAMGKPTYSLDADPEESTSVSEPRPGYRAVEESGKNEQQLVDAYQRVGAARRHLVDILLGLHDKKALPEGAGDALELAVKLASPDRRGKANAA